jgi:heparan-alpha-glucosaminide N-acetyltransferase
MAWQSGMKTTDAVPASSQRVVSLDAFRGFVMLSMLLGTLGLEKLAGRPVPGFFATQLSHAPWVGFHFEDLILPAFLFIIGVSMAISDERRRERGQGYGQRFLHVLERSAALFALGFLLSWLSSGRPYWGAGVLQVLALAYFGGFLFLGLSLRARAAVFAALLFFYWLFIFIIPVDDAGRNSYELFKNLVYLIDDAVTGEATRWGYLYPTITSVAVVVYGSIVGNLLLNRNGHRRFMRTLAVLGAGGVIAGLALHPLVPIIKRMFTSSYTLLTCGLATLLLLVFYWLIEDRDSRAWSFVLIVIGMNSIFVYMLNGLLSTWLLNAGGILLGPLAGWLGASIDFAKNLFRLAVEWLVCLWLFRKQIFFRL